MNLPSILLISFGYLVGSIPTAYICGRWLKGIDLRQYGSGTVSGSMVYEHVAHWAVVPVGLFDIAKAAIPTWLGVRLGLGTSVAAAAGLAAAIGHNWPLYLNFTGGRGLSPMIGLWLVLFWPCAPWMMAFLAVGWRINSAPWALIGLVTLPIFAHFVGGPDEVTPIAIAMLLITLIKRIEANRRPLPMKASDRRKVILRRLFLDRDVASQRDWIHRVPESAKDD